MDLSRCTDEELLARSRRTPVAFGVFYRRHVGGVLAYFSRRTRSPDVAADLMAETFAAALLGLERYEPEPVPASAWLYAIARHKLFDSYRRGRVEADARRALALEPLELDDDDRALVEGLAGTQYEQDVALRLLADLPPEQRAAVHARVLDEQDYPDIAARLECSEAVVRKRVSRGLRALRTQLQEKP